MAVQPAQVQVRQVLGQHRGQLGHGILGSLLPVRPGLGAHRGRDLLPGQAGGVRGEGEAELLVLVGGGDELVGLGVHPGGHPDHHRRGDSQLPGDPLDQQQLRHGVGDDAAHPGLQSLPDLLGGLVVPVQGDAGGLHPGGQPQGQLAPGGRVQVQPLLAGPAHDGGAQEGLAGVVDADLRPVLGEGLGEGRAEGRGAGAEDLLGLHVQRGAEALGERTGAVPVQGQLPVGAAPEGVRPDHRVQGRRARGRCVRARCIRARRVRLRGGRGGDARVGLPGHHMRSGVDTPSRPSPLARTWAVASFRARRVRCTSETSSSPWGTTRQESYQRW